MKVYKNTIIVFLLFFSDGKIGKVEVSYKKTFRVL